MTLLLNIWKKIETKWVNFDERVQKQYDFCEKSLVFQSFSLKLADMYLIISFLKYHIVKREMNKFFNRRKLGIPCQSIAYSGAPEF